MKIVLLIAALLLGGCGAIVPVLSGIAAGSTLLKNEFNCSLAAPADCVWPEIRLP